MERRHPERPSSPLRGELVLVLGIGLVVVLALIDVLADDRSDVLITTLVLGPSVVSLLGTARQTAIVAIVSVTLTIVSGVWNDNFDELGYGLRIAIGAIAGGVAFVAAAGRQRVQASRERFTLLSAVAEMTDGTLSLDQTGQRLTELIVPAFADACALDVVGGEELRRLDIRADGPEAESVMKPLGDDVPPDSGLEHTPDGASRLEVPLRARGRELGLLSLVRTARSEAYRPDDVGFAEVLAGRAALALDNAGLFAELETAEAQLSAALSGLAEAVTVQSPTGALVYVNEAAARDLGFESVQALRSTPPEEIVARFDSFHEDGTPLRLDELPGRRLLAGLPAPPLVLRAVDRRTGEERWRVTKATAVCDREGKPIMAVNVIEDITEVKEAELAQRLLARAGQILASSLEYEHTLQAVAELAVPDLADWCAVSIPDEDGECLRQVAIAHVDPTKLALGRRLTERYPTRLDEAGGTAEVFRTGEPQVVEAIDDALLEEVAHDPEHLELLRGLGMRAVLFVPMIAAGRTIGVLTLVSAESGRAFAPGAEVLAAELARRAGVAVDNARLYTERTEMAETLQDGLRPPALPATPGWSVATLYQPAGDVEEVGGDFYDVFAAGDDWMVVVGDVTGQGAQAATLTGLARYTLRAVAQLTADPALAISHLNGTLRDQPDLSLVTAVCARVARRENGSAELTVAACGHPPPLLLRDGQAAEIAVTGGIAGAFDDEDWQACTVELEPGDTLVFYTDGVTDAVGHAERFGEERLRAAIAGGPSDPGGLVAHLEATLTEFQAGARTDDMAILALRLEAAPAPRTPA